MKRLRPRPLTAWLVSGAALGAATVVMLSVRASLDKAHIALVLLLVVLGGSAIGGRLLGLTLAGTSFLVFNWFFLRPYYTFVIADPLDWLVLAAFLVTGIAAAQLLYRAQEEARIAGQRAEEIDRLTTLGVEAISVGSAEQSLTAVINVVRSSLQVDMCEVYPAATSDVVRSGSAAGAAASDQTRSLVKWVMTSGNAATEHSDGTVHLAGSRPATSELPANARGPTLAVLLPLKAKLGVVGVLRISSANGVNLDEARLRFLDAMSHYVALAVDRVRLVGEAEHAAALRESDRLKDALLAAVSHDLRTPLTTIRALAAELRPLGDERAEIIEQEAERLNRMVADLLDLARLNAGELPVRPEINAVDDLLGAMLQRVEPALKAGRIDVVLPAGDMLLLGKFDLVHALRILVNLVDNAAKHAPSLPVEVRAKRDGRDVVISVSDRGSGIPPAELERIFTPFYRPPGSAPDASRQGAGLGLSIARRLAEIQGGTLTAANREGGGSTFTLRLPAADASTPPEPGESL